MKQQLQKLRLQPGDLVFISCEGASQDKINELNAKVHQALHEMELFNSVTVLCTNFPITIKKVNAVGGPIINIKAKMNLNSLQVETLRRNIQEKVLRKDPNKPNRYSLALKKKKVKRKVRDG
jgi:hypothetical protein